jgi:hypothetical protein
MASGPAFGIGGPLSVTKVSAVSNYQKKDFPLLPSKRYDPSIPAPPSRTCPEGACVMFTFMIVMAFVAMIAGPAILSSIQKARSREHDF